MTIGFQPEHADSQEELGSVGKSQYLLPDNPQGWHLPLSGIPLGVGESSPKATPAVKKLHDSPKLGVCERVNRVVQCFSCWTSVLLGRGHEAARETTVRWTGQPEIERP